MRIYAFFNFKNKNITSIKISKSTDTDLEFSFNTLIHLWAHDVQEASILIWIIIPTFVEIL